MSITAAERPNDWRGARERVDESARICLALAYYRTGVRSRSARQQYLRRLDSSSAVARLCGDDRVTLAQLLDISQALVRAHIDLLASRNTRPVEETSLYAQLPKRELRRRIRILNEVEGIFRDPGPIAVIPGFRKAKASAARAVSYLQWLYQKAVEFQDLVGKRTAGRPRSPIGSLARDLNDILKARTRSQVSQLVADLAVDLWDLKVSAEKVRQILKDDETRRRSRSTRATPKGE